MRSRWPSPTSSGASRWRFLIRPVKEIGLKEVIALNWIGFFAIFALPLRLGEVARPALTKLRHQISVSIGFGTVAVERVVDGLVTSLCVAWALFALPRRETDDVLAQALRSTGTWRWESSEERSSHSASSCGNEHGPFAPHKR